MIRLLSVMLFVGFSFACTDCSAQLFRRQTRVQPTPIARPTMAAQRQYSQPSKIEFGRYSTYRNPTISRILDGKTSRVRNPAEVESRYVGAFHQTYFDNIGLPNGDIGLRGNGINWRGW
ncbi:MAG: hypothetical protein AB8B55_00765 [Mariniblastus sp.]